MKHIVVGVGVAAAVVITFVIWALLGELVGPAWAIAIMAFATLSGVGAGVLDYLTEKENA
jgi:hypothetical protein